jgi:hypothetical protein
MVKTRARFPLTNFLVLGIPRPRTNGPFELDLDDIFKPGIDHLLSVLAPRIQARAKLLRRLEEQHVPLIERRILLDRSVIRCDRVDGIAQLEVASGVEVPAVVRKQQSTGR